MSWFTRFRKTTIRSKVTGFTLALLFSLVIGFGSVLYITQDLSQNFDALFSRSLMLKDLETQMTLFEGHLETYLQTKDSDSFVGFMDQKEKINTFKVELTVGLSDDQLMLQMQNMATLLGHYLSGADEAIQFKRARNTEATLVAYNRVQTQSHYLRQMMNTLHNSEFDANLNRYLVMTQRMNTVKTMLVGIFIILFLWSAVFVFDFTQNISEPIEALSHYAKRISQGEYGVPVASAYQYDEASVLFQVFSDMSVNLSHHIEDLKDKAQTETELRLSAVENLKMQNMLKQAELMALQAQINPHFLFNTINAGLQLAILEDAEQTANFLDHMARMFRYNIQRLDNTVTLQDELLNLKHYYHLMKVRFQDMIEISFDIPPASTEIRMPPMILQPIVENALIHGFKHKETPGRIEIQVSQTIEQLTIKICDNGTGMDQETLDRLKTAAYQSRSIPLENPGHTTGLGLANVYQRLSVFFETKEVMSLTSVQNEGTCVTLNLPLRKLDDDENFDS